MFPVFFVLKHTTPEGPGCRIPAVFAGENDKAARKFEKTNFGIYSKIGFMQWFEKSSRDENNIRQLYLALAVTLGGNVLLAVIKWTAAVRSGSSALHADAWNSISDVFYSLTLIIGLLISIRPADLSHPHGHERFEPIVGLIISLSMGWAGVEAALGAIRKLRGEVLPIDPALSIPYLLLSAAVKCVMFLVIRAIAKRIASKALNNAAQDNLTDMLTSAAAAAGILLSAWIHPLADPIAGLLLSVWIFRSAFSALMENVNYLTGHGATEPELYELRDEIASVPGVRGVHQLFAEYVGTKLRLDVHIDLEADMPLSRVHEIETEIEERMAKRRNIDHVFIHAEPLSGSAQNAGSNRTASGDPSSNGGKSSSSS